MNQLLQQPHRVWAQAWVLAAALVVVSLPLAAVAAPQRPPRASLEDFEKTDLKNLDEVYQDFYDKVEVIITPEEKEVFLRLESNLQRDLFVERFWNVRDPSLGTPQNEYKDEYERRLEYVEKHYGRSQPRAGRKTDRGRMYLLLGEPMNVKTYPWTQLAYPVETWWYHANPKLGVPAFFYLAFFQRDGSGEYRLYSPLVDGPTALLNPAGVNQMRSIQQGEEGRLAQMDGEVGAAYEVLMDVDAELAQISLSLIPGDYGAQAGFGSMSSMMMIGDIESIPETIMPSASWAYPILTGMVEADVRFESLPIRANAIALLDSSGIPFIHYGLLTDGQRLNLNQYEDSYYVTFQVAGSVVDSQNRIVTAIKAPDGSTSKILQADLNVEEATRLRGGPLAYMDRLPVIEGNYNFDVVLENNVSREYGRQEFRLEVPTPWPTVLRSSDPLLLWAIYDNPDYDPFGDHYPFQVDRFGLIPALDPTFEVATGINVFQQIYLPRNHQGMLTATYRITDGSTVVVEQTTEIDPARADRNGTVNHAFNVTLDGVPPGDYQLSVDIEGDDSGAISQDITVVEAVDQDKTPYLHMNVGPPSTDPGYAYDLAQQFRSLGMVDEAIAALAGAIDRVQDDDMLRLQIELMMEAERYADVKALLTPLQVEDPNDTEILRALAAVAAQTGENYESIRYLERVRLVTNEESTEVLNPLASAYYADGQLAKAKSILEISLTVDPEQPEIRRLLDLVLGGGQ